MYVCEKHGKLKNEWCNDCENTIKCDCKDIESSRFKDLVLDYDNFSKERTFTIYVHACQTCGRIHKIEQ